jgi:hypothetical protein
MTQRIKASRLIAIGITMAIVALPISASASLGGDASSVDADRVRVQGALLRNVRSDAYTLNEVQSSSGTLIRQYISSTGTVFGVAWEGPWLPNLRQILGPYFDTYQRTVQATPGNRRARGSFTIDLPDLVVQMRGHPRAFSGRAYVPRLIPQRVQAESIR